jgi:hypothetical protein
MNVTKYTQFPPWDAPSDPSQCLDDRTLPATPGKYCILFHFTPSPVAWEFFRQSKTAPDQLRMRMAHVWHQIFVYSGPTYTYGAADFHQRREIPCSGRSRTRSRGSARAVAWLPELGAERPEFNGIKAERGIRRAADAALRSAWQLRDDGTPCSTRGPGPSRVVNPTSRRALIRLDRESAAPGQYVDVTRDVIHRRDDSGNARPTRVRRMPERRHRPSAEGSASAEVAALITRCHHPNTPPRPSRQLIQKTVTKSPTPGCAARIAAVFKAAAQLADLA